MSERAWKTMDVVRRLAAGELTVADAAEVLGLSRRQLQRVKRRVATLGRDGVVHGNTGRVPHNRPDKRMLDRIVKLARTKYCGFNDRQFAEKLVEDEGLAVSRSAVQRLLRGAGVAPARPRHADKHRKRRERKAQSGQMILWDGSQHDWLEGRGPRMCLIGAIDDATGDLLPGAHFVEQECAAGYLRVLREIVKTHGIPCSMYMDKHGSLKRNDGHWTLEEELRGQQTPTQVGQALAALEIEAIYAHSPQAKGRVERPWGTLQDRFVSELRLAKVRTLDKANELLEWYRPRYNRSFPKPPLNPTPAWRPVRSGMDIDRVCSFQYAATVNNDNTVRLAGRIIDIPPGPRERSYARARVEVRQFLDGSWHVYHEDCEIATQAATAVTELRALGQRERSAASRAFRKAVQGIAVSLP